MALEGHQMIQLRMPGQYPQDPRMDEDVHLGNRTVPLQGGKHCSRQECFADSLVDPDEQDAPGCGQCRGEVPSSPGSPQKSGCHQGQAAFGDRFH
jgi:hypothetical protein